MKETLLLTKIWRESEERIRASGQRSPTLREIADALTKMEDAEGFRNNVNDHEELIGDIIARILANRNGTTP